MAYRSRQIHGLGIAALAFLYLVAPPGALAQTSNITTIASFNGMNGREPWAGLTLSGNTLYGTTHEGGAYGYGTVFSVPKTGGVITVLASFNNVNGGGANSHSGLTLIGRTLYGTTGRGGANDKGAVFSVPKTGGKITTLASFTGKSWCEPNGNLILSGSTLYGTTRRGGANGSSVGGYGTVFSVPTSGGKVTILANFSGANGAYPAAGLTLIGNTLYGTTREGCADGNGEVFSVPTTGGKLTVLASFNGKKGSQPLGRLTLIGSTLYGSTIYGEFLRH